MELVNGPSSYPQEGLPKSLSKRMDHEVMHLTGMFKLGSTLIKLL